MDTNMQKYFAFIKTVELGSFTKAAEILNYSQSGISRMISDLEKEWKVSLLERGRAGRLRLSAIACTSESGHDIFGAGPPACGAAGKPSACGLRAFSDARAVRGAVYAVGKGCQGGDFRNL